jgi:diketogulonate reductase-like aldo/keto reductase
MNRKDNMHTISETLRLPPIGLGTMGFGGYFTRDRSNFEHCVGLIRHAYEQGIRIIDTAEVYGQGCAEEIIGTLPQSIKSELFLMSKFSPENSRPKDIRIALEKTLKRTKREYVDVYQPHWPSGDVTLASILEELIRLREAGKTRYIGVSNFPPNILAASPPELMSEIRFIQAEFNPTESSTLERYRSTIEANNGLLVAYSPFREGKIFSGSHLKQLQELAEKTKYTLSQLILLWIVQSGMVWAIPKSMSIERINEYAEAMGKSLPEAELSDITKIFETKTVELAVGLIIQENEEDSDRKIYLTLSEAIENRFGLFPGPLEIADEIAANGGRLAKPIKVKALPGGRYGLVEGRLRFWGWRILHQDKKPILSVIVD